MRAAAGLAIAGLLLWLVFRSTEWGEVAAAIQGADVAWLLAAQALLFGACVARAWRWRYVVRAVHPASFRALFSATQIGLLANFSVPARVGELVRATVFARLSGVSLSRSLALVTLDRVNDVVGLLPVVLIAGFALAADAQVVLPAGALGNSEPLTVSAALVLPAAALLGAAALGAGLALAALFVWREAALRAARSLLTPVPAALAKRILHVLSGFAEGLHVFRSRGDLLRAVGWSLVCWGLDVAAVAALLPAFGIDLQWRAPFVVLALVSMAIVVPLTPGVVGQFHLPVVVGLLLTIPELSAERAKAIAIVDHVVTLLPIAALGVFSLLRERLGLRDLLRETERAEVVRASTPLPDPLPPQRAE